MPKYHVLLIFPAYIEMQAHIEVEAGDAEEAEVIALGVADDDKATFRPTGAWEAIDEHAEVVAKHIEEVE